MEDLRTPTIKFDEIRLMKQLGPGWEKKVLGMKVLMNKQKNTVTIMFIIQNQYFSSCT